jgi:hypothetical protein
MFKLMAQQARSLVGGGKTSRKTDTGHDLADTVSTVVKSMAGLPAHVVDGVTNVVSSVTDYMKVAEQEETKRTEIRARRDVALATIQAQRDTVMEMIRYTFQERALVLQKHFDVLDKALASGQTELVHTSLTGMVAVIQSSPFKNVQEMQQALGSKDFVVRLE